MAENEEAHLNRAYYGPSVPASKSYHRRSRGSGPLGCCCSCIFSLVFKIIFAAVVFMGLAFLVFWLIVRPTKVKFHVTDATLTQFNFSADSNLHYNLALNLTIRNPNKKIGVYYDRIEARALYEGQRLNTVTLTPFYQGHKTTNVFNPVFKGQQLIVGSDLLEEFNEQKSAGVYEIEMKLYLRIRFKLGGIKTGKFKPRIECDLKVPLSQNGTSVGTFQTEKCSVDYFNY
ncbi:NDR1/HIN1-like protein 10 [Argentina anserina]|uniref:NDR1/HIN1-like protein 10 n=1 Tax=Argentina anserina TaxID=57926 RepID=UPI0021766AF5|nr:NDR1/HIN1-like protein 10 [Potentilla anserina]